jgi:ATP-dependent helicase/nuclease subunit B
VETWLRNPYEVYARRILRLEALPALDEEPGAAERGQLVHGLLERFARAWPGALGEEAATWLEAALEDQLERLDDRPGLALLWRPRLRRALRGYLEIERARRPQLQLLVPEQEGRLVLPGPAGPFELTAKADRLELRLDGSVAVVDYKTGQPPKQHEVLSGLAAQLPLEAAMLLEGAFPGLVAQSVAAFEIWRLSGGRGDGITLYPGGRSTAGQPTPDALANAALAGFKALVERFDDPATPYLAYPRPAVVRYHDYRHLARVDEWLIAEEDT